MCRLLSKYERLSQAERSGHFGIRREVFSPTKNLKPRGPQNFDSHLYHTVEIHCEHILTFLKKLIVFRVVFCVKHNHAWQCKLGLQHARQMWPLSHISSTSLSMWIPGNSFCILPDSWQPLRFACRCPELPDLVNYSVENGHDFRLLFQLITGCLQCACSCNTRNLKKVLRTWVMWHGKLFWLFSF